MIQDLIEINYASVVILLFFLVFIFTNDYFAQRIRTLFLLADVLLLCLVVVDSIEYWTASLDTLTSLRILMSAIGYSIRPIIIYVVILLLGNAKGKKYAWLSIPLVVNTLIAFSAFFVDYAYSYTMDNQFVRGPLGYFAFVTSGFYEIVLLICTIKLYKSVKISETIISVVVLFTFMIAIFMESVWKYEGIINVSGAIALTFYYLYLNTQQFKRDPLTNVLNRRCFYMDAEKHKANLSAVLSIDLNDLKKWNDEYGHAKGDEAICTIVCCVEAVLPSNCYLYRVGGDEFMLLCFNQEKTIIQQLKNQIKEKASQTPFSCAIGVAYNDEQIDFNKLCSQADKDMYEDKQQMKHTE
ncbi:MAG: GGDEF domain-containing protein [Lachnospiraceae bacterium]|nr:GGDEF domain-containing protein [Lachnospiraceae bacterium]